MLTENREFNEIYEQYKNLILKAAYTYSGSYSAAEDITQDTFLKLYMGYDSMKKKNISQYFLIKSGINNKTLYSLRKNKNITLNTLEDLCRILDCTPNDVVQFTDLPKNDK